MDKQVRLTPKVYEWLEEKSNVVDQYWVMSVVKWAPRERRTYYGRNRFTIEIPRKIDGKKVKILLRVEETESELVVLLVHMED